MLGCAVALAVSVAFLSGGAAACEVSSGGSLKGVPAKLVPIYQRASAKYRLGAKGPSILAAINWVETGFGTNLGVSYAGAEGWMQFMPETWTAYGVDANGDGIKNPDDPEDAIHAAANYLRASGAPGNWHDAIFAYNHAEWYVEKVNRAAARYAEATDEAAWDGEAGGCGAALAGNAVLDGELRLYAPRAFKAIPARLWVGYGSPQAVDARIWPNVVWLLETFELRVTAARESGHATHGDGTAIDVVPASGSGWDATALRASLALGWTPECGWNGSAPVCPLVPAIQFVGYNGYDSHGDPAHAVGNAHLHVSWRASEYGCSSLCAPREWVEIFPMG
jgi:hypothetical protein